MTPEDYPKLLDQLNRLGSLPPLRNRPLPNHVALPEPEYRATVDENDEYCPVMLITTTLGDDYQRRWNQPRFHFVIGDVWRNEERMSRLAGLTYEGKGGLAKVLGHGQKGAPRRAIDITEDLHRNGICRPESLKKRVDSMSVAYRAALACRLPVHCFGWLFELPAYVEEAQSRRWRDEDENWFEHTFERAKNIGEDDQEALSTAVPGVWADPVALRFIREADRFPNSDLELSTGRVIHDARLERDETFDATDTPAPA